MAGVMSYCLPVNSMITKVLLSGCDSMLRPKHSAFSFAWGGNGESTQRESGGGSGIRTHDTVARIHAFQACAFSHSAIPPLGPPLGQEPREYRCRHVEGQAACRLRFSGLALPRSRHPTVAAPQSLCIVARVEPASRQRAGR